jgi:hypothetical protein
MNIVYNSTQKEREGTMNYKTRGKLFFVLGVALVIVGAWYDDVALGAVGGVVFAWSYWYWWRDWWLRLFCKRGKDNGNG